MNAEVSRLALGTLQLGVPYGVANAKGVPSREEAFAILDAAWESGVDMVDTAAAYGDSEALLGDWMASRNAHPRIVTKLPPLPKVAHDVESIAIHYEAHLQASLARFGRPAVWGLLLHEPADFLSWPREIAEVLHGFRKQGLAAHVGASLYRSDDCQALLSAPELDLFQIPFNIFDQRFLPSANPLQTASARSKILLGRSCFLQGLFFLEPDEAASRVPGSREYVMRLQRIAWTQGMDVRRLALGFALSFPELSGLVLGVESAAQMRENQAAYREGPLTPQLVAEIREAFASVPSSLRDPSRWPARKIR
jgi:aryl-alcohol dehydrogenase-like predicted oxidoreductase